MNKKKEPFSCPSCGERVPFSKVWMLSNNCIYRCEKCKIQLKPERMNLFYFMINSIVVIGMGNLLIEQDHSFWIVMLGSFMVGILGYLIGIVYVYKTIRFKVK